MSIPRWQFRSMPGALLIAVGLSVVLRLASAAYQGNDVQPLPAVYDQVSYHALACRVLEGHGFSFDTNWWPATRAGEPTAHWSFFYTLYLTGVYALVGVHPLAARLLQALIVAVLHPWLSWRIGARLFGERAGLAAAFVAALYGYFVYFTGALVTEPYYIISILWSIDLAIRIADRISEGHLPGKMDWILLGLAIGITVLLRQVFLLFVPVLLLWLGLAGHRHRRPAQRACRAVLAGSLLSLAVVGLLVLPWTVRNYRAFDQFVLLNTNAGFAFFWGNHPYHGTSFVPILDGEGPSYNQLIPRELISLDEAALDRALMKEGFGFVLEDPLRFVLLSLSRTKEYFKFWPTSESGMISNVVRVGSFGVLLPMVLIGLGTHIRGAMRNGAELLRWILSGSGLLLMFALFYTLLHLLSWTLIRYRLPVDGVLVLFAGVGVVWLFDRSWVPRTSNWC